MREGANLEKGGGKGGQQVRGIIEERKCGEIKRKRREVRRRRVGLA
jgi:hypothetical protein